MEEPREFDRKYKHQCSSRVNCPIKCKQKMKRKRAAFEQAQRQTMGCGDVFSLLLTSFDRNYNLLKYSCYNDMEIDVFHASFHEQIQRKCLMMLKKKKKEKT